jgi:hypothetical protein
MEEIIQAKKDLEKMKQNFIDSSEGGVEFKN